jgi:hypothetical protein
MKVLCHAAVAIGLIGYCPLLLERESVVVNRLYRVTSIKRFDIRRGVAYAVKTGTRSSVFVQGC